MTRPISEAMPTQAKGPPIRAGASICETAPGSDPVALNVLNAIRRRSTSRPLADSHSRQECAIEEAVAVPVLAHSVGQPNRTAERAAFRYQIAFQLPDASPIIQGRNSRCMNLRISGKPPKPSACARYTTVGGCVPHHSAMLRTVPSATSRGCSSAKDATVDKPPLLSVLMVWSRCASSAKVSGGAMTSVASLVRCSLLICVLLALAPTKILANAFSAYSKARNVQIGCVRRKVCPLAQRLPHNGNLRAQIGRRSPRHLVGTAAWVIWSADDGRHIDRCSAFR